MTDFLQAAHIVGYIVLGVFVFWLLGNILEAVVSKNSRTRKIGVIGLIILLFCFGFAYYLSPTIALIIRVITPILLLLGSGVLVKYLLLSNKALLIIVGVILLPLLAIGIYIYYSFNPNTAMLIAAYQIVWFLSALISRKKQPIGEKIN
jgi:hypothetical protein